MLCLAKSSCNYLVHSFMPLLYNVILLLVITISLVPHLCVIITEWIFHYIVRLIKEIRDRCIYVPGFDRFSLNCMADAASRY